MAKVLYRPFEDSDFEPLAEIVQKCWHCGSNLPSREYAMAEASYDLARQLAKSTFSQVALVDGVPAGIVLARADDAHAAPLAKWGDVAASLDRTMEETEPAANERFHAWYDLIEAIDAKLSAQCDVPEQNEVTLLAVDAQVQGLGIGTVLFDAVSSYFASLGELKVYLYTDSDCSWPFYERHGMKRLISYRPNREERSLSLPREMYVYGMDLSA